MRATQYPGNTHSHSFGCIATAITGCSRRGCQPWPQATISGISGSSSIPSGFIAKAPAMSPWTSACSARVRPQPTQYQPVKAWNMHGGNGLLAAFGSKLRSNHTPAPTAIAADARPTAHRRREAAIEPAYCMCWNCSIISWYSAMPPELKK